MPKKIDKNQKNKSKIKWLIIKFFFFCCCIISLLPLSTDRIEQYLEIEIAIRLLVRVRVHDFDILQAYGT